MSDALEQSHAQQFEHALSTAITCRSIVKYNSSLSDEQKNEVIADIDATVKFLRDRLVVNASIESHMAIPPTGIDFIAQHSDDAPVSKAGEKLYQQKFAELYRIAQLYLDEREGHGLREFIARFNKAMATIDEVQAIIMQGQDDDTYLDMSQTEDLLHSVRGVIADMYSVFTELAHAIVKIVQDSGITVDTEEMLSIEQQPSAGQGTDPIEGISPLLHVYEAHMQLNEKKGSIASRISDATAFLIFLGENLGSDFHKRDEIVTHLNKVAKLLNDLLYLLSNYENATSSLLQFK